MSDDAAQTPQDISLNLGTPKEPLGEAAIVLRLWRTLKQAMGDQRRSQPMASLCLVRPDPAGYVIKPLVSAAEITHESALAGALETARLRRVGQIYLNADLERLPAPVRAE